MQRTTLLLVACVLAVLAVFALLQATSAAAQSGASVQRLSGADRYATSAAVAATFDTADTVYIAAGDNYPDALSAGAAAARDAAPLLLVPGDAAPPAVVLEQLQRLQPSRLVVVGGGAAVSDTTVQLLLAATAPAEPPADAYGQPVYADVGAPYTLPLTYNTPMFQPAADAMNEFAGVELFQFNVTVEPDIQYVADNQYPDMYEAYVLRFIDRCELHTLNLDLNVAVLGHELQHCLGYADSVQADRHAGQRQVCDDLLHPAYSRYTGHMSYCAFPSLQLTLGLQATDDDLCSLQLAGYIPAELQSCVLG